MAYSNWKFEERLFKGWFVNVWASSRKVARDGIVPLGWQHLEGNMNPRSQGGRTENNLERDEQTEINLDIQ